MSATITLAGRAALRPARKGAGSLEGQRRRSFWAFVLPALIIYVVFFIAPALVGVWASFTRWAGAGTDMHFIGIENYIRLTRDSYFHTAFLNTLAIVVRDMRAKVTVRTLLFLPYIISPIVMGIGFGLLLAPKGALNALLRAVGLGVFAIDWLGPDNEFHTIMIGIVWISIGFYLVLLMSGIDRIPPYFYEDAELNGANAFQRFRYVTLPLTWDIVTVAVVLWLIGAIRVFDFVFAFVGIAGYPPANVATLAIAQYAATTGGPAPAYEMGYGSAMGVFMLILIALLVVAVRRMMRRDALEF
jgi:raffinose/stachyose/melibiose transport system permease protein